MNVKQILYSVWLPFIQVPRHKAHFEKSLLLIVFGSLLHGCGLFGSGKGKVPTNSKQQTQQQNTKYQMLINNPLEKKTALASSSKEAMANHPVPASIEVENRLKSGELLNQDFLASQEGREALCAYLDTYPNMLSGIKSVLSSKINTLTPQSFNAILDKGKIRTKHDAISALISSDEVSVELLPIMRKHAFEQKDSAKIGLRYHLDNHRPNLSTAIKRIVGNQLDGLTEQSFNKLLDKTFILGKENVENNTFIIRNNSLDNVYGFIIHHLAHRAKVQVARNEAWPSDSEGRQALLQYFDTHCSGIGATIKQKITEIINSYTKASFNKFLDTRNFLMGKYPAELDGLDNRAYICALDAHIAETNDFSKLYAQVIYHLYSEANKEDLEEFKTRMRQLSDNIQAGREELRRRVTIPLLNLMGLFTSSLPGMATSEVIANIPTKNEVMKVLNQAKQFTKDEKEAIKGYIHDESSLGINASESAMFERLVRNIYSKLGDADRNIPGLLNFINDYAKDQKQKLEKKKQEILPKLQGVVNRHKCKQEIGSIGTCMVCDAQFKDLQQDSGLLSCGHRIHVPCILEYIAKTLLLKEQDSSYADPTCPHCRGPLML